MRSGRPSLWREPLQAVGMQQQQANQGAAGMWVYIPSKPADWNPLPRTVEEALDQLAASGSAVAAANMFVWQPGGTAGANVYTTLAALEAALQDVEGPKIVGVDTTHGAAAMTTTGMPAAGWRFNDTTWMPCLSTTALLITIGVGVKFAPSTQNLSFVRGTEVQNNATATVWTPTNGLALLRLDTAVLVGTTTGAFLDCTANITVVELENGSVLAGDGTHPQIKVEAAGTLDLALLSGSELEANVIGQGAAPGGVAQVQFDGSSVVTTTQVAGPVYTYTNFDPTPTFVYAPNAVAPFNRNVFASWTRMMDAASLVTGAKFMKLSTEGGFAGPFVADAGTWDLSSFTIDTSQTDTAAHRTLSFPDNAFLTGTETLYCRGNVILQSANTIAPVWVVGAGAGALLDMYGGTIQTSGAGAKPFLNTQGTGFANLHMDFNSILATGAGPSLQADVGSSISVRFFGGLGSGVFSLQSSALAGAGTVNVHLAAETLWSSAQAGVTGTLNFIWDPIINTIQAAAATGNGTTTTSAVTGNIAQKKSGKVDVQGLATGTISANGTVTVSLLRDAAPILALPALTILADTSFAIPIFFTDTLPDLANHTYSVQAVADGAHTIAVGAGGNLIRATEQ